MDDLNTSGMIHNECTLHVLSYYGSWMQIKCQLSLRYMNKMFGLFLTEQDWSDFVGDTVQVRHDDSHIVTPSKGSCY